LNTKGEHLKKKHLQILISICLTLVVCFILIPFSKYFLLASYQETGINHKVQQFPIKIETPEKITAPTITQILANKETSSQVLGQVIIPKVNIVQPIFAGLTNKHMVQGVVSLFPTRRPNKKTLTLIGHHVLYYNWGNSLLFGGIQDLKIGDPVYLSYLKDNYTYKVESNVTIKATDINRLADKGPNYLMLVTCNTSQTTPYRILVTAKKIQDKQDKIRTTDFKKIINKTKLHQHQQYIKIFILPLLLILFIYLLLLYFVWYDNKAKDTSK
jgi:LPXTG-site transpeptidase (sortase) family protein